MPSTAQQLLEIPALPDLALCHVEGGPFQMGDEYGDLWDACRPVHPVEVSSFYMGKFQVTQRLWQEVMHTDPSHFKGPKRPVENVSWEDVQIFFKKLNAMPAVAAYLKEQGLAAAFRLPTEAGWEYAARGGRHSQGHRYAGSDSLRQVGWYDKNSEKQTHDVGLLLPNELGIHDLSGNVWEWCEDDWHSDYKGAPKDGTAWVDLPKRGGARVRRGGSSFHHPLYCRPANRYYHSPGYRNDNLGFRLALPFQSVG